MSYQRRVKYLERMFNDCATHTEKLKVNELYNQGFKGSAVVFMLRRVYLKWQELMGEPKTLKITKNGQTKFVQVA